MKCKVKIEVARYQTIVGTAPAITVDVRAAGVSAEQLARISEAATEAAEKLAAILAPKGRP